MSIIFQLLCLHLVRVLRIALTAVTISFVISGCSTAPPEGLTSVTPFDVHRYLGKWYEIARLDHSFERGLSDVSATYSLKPDGSLEVINRGFNTKKTHGSPPRDAPYLQAAKTKVHSRSLSLARFTAVTMC